MTDEKKNIPRSQASTTSFPHPEQVREQAERKAQSIQQPDFSSMTPEKIHQQFHALQVKQIEVGLKNEQLRSQLEEYAYRDGFLTAITKKTTNPVPPKSCCREDDCVGVQGSINDISERKKAEKALQESEAHYKSLTEKMNDILWTIDLDLNITYISPSIEKVLGFTVAERRKQPLEEQMPPEAMQMAVDRLAEELQFDRERDPERHDLLELDFYHKNGSVRCLETALSFIRDEQGKPLGIHGLSRDVTDYKHAEKRLQESEERLDLAMMVKNEGIWDWNLISDETVFDDRYYTMAGYAPNEFPQKFTAWRERVHPEDLPIAEAAIKAYLSGYSARFDTEFRFRHRDGSWIWIRGQGKIVKWDQNGTPLRMIGTHTDITERKNFEEALRQSENYYRAIFETSGTAMFIVEEDTTISLVNSNLAELAGYSKQEIEGKKSWTEFVHPDDVARMKENHYLRRRNPHAAPRQYEFRLIARNEETRDILLGVDMIPETDQSIASCIDITERKRAEDALQSNYTLLQIAGETAKFGGWTVDLENNICTWSNVVADIHDVPHGYAPPLQDAINFYAPEWREKITRVFSACAEKGIPYDEEMQIVTTTGKRVWVRTTGKAVENDKGPIIKIQGSFQDITYHKQTEQKLIEQKDLLSAIYRNAPLVMMVVNSERRIQQVNGFAAQFVGRDVEEMLGMRGGEALRCLHVLDDPKGCGFGEYCQQCVIRHLVLDTLETGETHLQIEAPYYFKGEYNKVQEMAFLTSTTSITVKGARMVLLTLQDITERKQAEQQLRESKEKYRMLVENLTEVIYTLDEKGRITYVSPTVELTGGYTSSELLGKPFVDFVHPEDRERRLEPFHEILSGIDEASEYRFVTKDSQVVWVRTTARPLLKEGRVIGLQGVLVDITKRKKAEQERDKLQTQLNHAQKMESVGRLAGGVAHDFNNKLSIINGYAELAIEKIDPSDPLHKKIQEIHNAGMQSADIVRKLLAFARQQAISPLVIDLNDTISSMLNMLQRLIGENIELVWHPGNNLWPVKIDPSQVDQVMVNLAVNARDAITDVGNIIIETTNIEVDQDYCTLYHLVPGKYIMLTVSDNGSGMDKETLGSLFEPFFTTKEIGKGTGLGLATVYGIVEQNNGFINVSSEPGAGTTFKIYLPRHEAEEPSLKAGVESTRHVPTGTETILVVEDEKGVLLMARRILERLGYTVLIAEKPFEAVKLSEAYEGTIHLLLTDVVLPEMNGRDLASKMTMSRPELKTLYMSSYTANEIAHTGVLDPGVLFIQKPLSIQELATKVREAIEQE